MQKNIINSLIVTTIVALVFGVSLNVALAAGGDHQYISCPLSPQAGRTIVNFSTPGNLMMLRSDKAMDEGAIFVPINLPAGDYKVTAFSFDSYGDRVNVNQPNEKYNLALYVTNGPLITTTGYTTDLQDNVETATRLDVLNNSLHVSQAASAIAAVHATYPDTSSPNSISPGCVAFDSLNTPPPPPPHVDETLVGSCSVNPNTVSVGNSVNWGATASGGNGSYVFSWTGTDGLSAGNVPAVSKTYSTPGTKSGTVTITSNGQSVVRTCTANVTEIVNNNLTASCNASPSSVEVDSYINWSASVSGGTGAYTYAWTGTDGLYGNSSVVSRYYSNTGTKYGYLTVTSGGQTVNTSCSARVKEDNNNYDDDLTVSCYANPTTMQVGTRMNWYANVSGGDGDYDYDWSGTDGLNSSSRSPAMTYYDSGRKSATVRVYSNGQSVSRTCYATVNQNSVLAFSQSNQTPIESAVYLSQVPYTGLADNLNLVWFMLGLALFSAYVAYVVMANKKVGRGEIN